jgi:hypothetical protein
VGFVVDKVALGQDFLPSTSVFPCQFHATGAPSKWKSRKNLIIFITGLHNNPQGCGASLASGAGPFTTHKKNWLIFGGNLTDLLDMYEFIEVQLKNYFTFYFLREDKEFVEHYIWFK